MIGAIHIGSLLINVLVAVVLAGAIVTCKYLVLAWKRNEEEKVSARYFVRPPTRGKRGKFWVGIYDAEGKRVFQTSPPGYAHEHEAMEAIQGLVDGPIEYKMTDQEDASHLEEDEE